MGAQKLLTVVVFVFVVMSCEVSGKCSIEPCKDSPTKFKASFSPCPVKLGGNINITAEAVAPRDVDSITYTAVIYYVWDMTNPYLQIDGSANCTSAKKLFPFKCPVKKGQKMGVNMVKRLPDSIPLDSDSYYVNLTLKSKGKSGKLEKLLCADVYFDLISPN